jgi:two-component system, OmpR family, response regulator
MGGPNSRLRKADPGTGATRRDGTNQPTPPPSASTIRPVSQQLTVGVCEDDDELRGVVRSALERDGYRVRATASGAEAVAAFAEHAPDVLILDIGLPDADGRDVCQALRARGVVMPVLFLTARDALSDRLSGFHSGGDDYVTKPFAVAELIVRIEALLRRSPSPAPAAHAGVLRLDPGTHGVAGPDETVPLTPTEFRLLAELAAHTGEVVRRAALVRAGWPAGAIVSNNTLDAYISRIRGKLRQAAVPETVANVRGVGYALR